MKPLKIKKVVMTGGPSAGKTTVAQALQREFSHDISVVPEAATLLFEGGFPRSDDSEAVRCAQKAIYFVQKELEVIYSHQHPERLMLCDRGSVDGMAFWPGAAKGFFHAVKSSQLKELKRYDLVLHLDTADRDHYDFSNSNRIRSEDFKTAQKLNDKIKKAWAKHPHQLIIPHQDFFLRKIEMILVLMREILQGADIERVSEIHKAL